jgi:hypothetical protein
VYIVAAGDLEVTDDCDSDRLGEMDELSAKLSLEIEKKRKSSEPLRDARASVSEPSSTGDAIVQEKKKKVYLTNGQVKFT